MPPSCSVPIMQLDRWARYACPRARYMALGRGSNPSFSQDCMCMVDAAISAYSTVDGPTCPVEHKIYIPTPICLSYSTRPGIQ